jgi:VanZ family protein
MRSDAVSRVRASGAWRWALVAAYMAAIFFASGGPGPDLPPVEHADKVLHAAAYGGLAGLAAWALARGRLRTTTARVAITAWALAAVYGASDELHQYFVPGRQSDWRDLAADAIGAAAAAGALWAWGIIARGSE